MIMHSLYTDPMSWWPLGLVMGALAGGGALWADRRKAVRGARDGCRRGTDTQHTAAHGQPAATRHAQEADSAPSCG